MRWQVPAFLCFALVLAPIPAFAQQQRAAVAQERHGFEASIPSTDRIAFRVVREDVEIGSHELTFRRQGERLEVDVAIDLKVTFLGVSLYRYSHRAQEVWQNGRLVALQTTTDNNGTPFKVSGKATDGGFLVSAGGKDLQLPSDLMPSSHWNRAWLEGRPLLNTQTGERILYKLRSQGSETIATGTGSLAAERFTIAGDLRKDIWFDAQGRWVKTSFAAPDGSTISYVLQ